MIRQLILAALLATTAAGTASGGKPVKPPPPPPPPVTTAPEIAYVRISGGSRRFYELKMANEDGTGAYTVFSSRDVGQMMVDLGPRPDRTLLLIQGGRLSLMTYEIQSTGPRMTGLEQIIDLGHVGAATATISPTGDDISYIKNGERTLWRYNLNSKTHTKLVTGAGILGAVDFSPDGQTIYFVEQTGPETFVLKSVPSGGGTVTPLGPTGFYTELAVAPNGDIALVDIGDWPVNRLSLYVPSTGTLTYLTEGYAPSFKCNNSRMIVQRVNSDNSVALVQRDLPAGTENYFSQKEFYWPDYMPTC